MKYFEIWYTVTLSIGLVYLIQNNVWIKIMGTFLVLGASILLLMQLRNLKKDIDAKDAAIARHLLDGMQALAELSKKAFNQLKVHDSKLERANAQIGEHAAKLHRLDLSQHRLVRKGTQKEVRAENPETVKRVIRETSLPSHVPNSGNQP
jgi:ABC-type transport system involved in cytochrome bd biosynthesis fused ATPase/permease subunit